MSDNLKIISLKAENFKRLKAVEINPTGNLVVVSGANEQGKTSVLDAIWAALGGADMTKVTNTTKALRNGEKKGFVTLDLGDIIVTRKWSESGSSTLTVENADGARYSSPQAILDGLIGKIAIDPLSFAAMEEKKQRELLLKLVNIGIDFEKTAQYRKGAYENRTDINRNIKLLESQLLTFPEVPADTPDEEVSSSDIIAAMKAAQETITENTRTRNAVEDLKGRVKFFQTSIDNYRAEIAAIEKKIADVTDQLANTETQLQLTQDIADTLEDPDISVFQAKLTAAESINKAVGVKKQVATIAEQIEKLRAEAQVQTDRIEAIDKEKADALAAAKFPIDGLSVSDDGVTYKGVPFAQCSSAERLRVSIAIAMAMSPKLRVIRITDGSLIDSRNMSTISKMCSDNDYQCWIEKVDESGKVGVFLEDGEVKAVN